MQTSRNRGYSAVSRASGKQSTPTNRSVAGGHQPSNRSNSPFGGGNKKMMINTARFTIPDRPPTPSVLMVFPATARQQVLTEQKQRAASASSRTGSPLQQQRSASSPNRNNNNTNATAGGRSSSPRGLLLNNNNNRSAAASRNNSPNTMMRSINNNSPSNKNPHRSVITPFRDVHAQPMSQTLDGRLLYLLKDFSSTVIPTQDQKVQNIASRLRRSGILNDKEMNALETCHQRNQNFMGTIEKILGEAVEQGVDMRRSVVHQSYEIWRACNDANTYITTLLDTAQNAIGVGKFSRSNVHGNAFNQNNNASMARSSSAFNSPAMSRGGRGQSPIVNGNNQIMQQQQRRGSSSNNNNARRAYSPIPQNFGQISKPTAPPRQQLAHFDKQYTRGMSQPPPPSSSQNRGNNDDGIDPNDFSQAPTIHQNNNALAPNNLFIQAPPDLQQFQAQQQHYQHQQQNTRRSTSRGGTAGNTGVNTHALQVGSVQVEDAREAQQMFEKLFGPEEGRTRFLHWLSELPESTIQQLHRSLTH